jgi:Secretion system C-terminal sorting domain
MKKLLLLFLLITSCLSYSQYINSAPWMQNLASSRNLNPTIDDQVAAFNEYWLTHDRSQKGSGFKPFMRWENHWRNKTNAQGYQITPQEMWDVFNQKKSSRSNRSQAVPTSIWQPIGPFSHTNTGSWSSGQGRVNVVYVDPSNENTIYIGTPAGGIWKSTTGGTSWTALSDNLPQIGVSGIAVDPNNSDVIYISTGDCDGGDSYSIGVLKSTDGGLTWNTTGLTFNDTNSYAGDILIHPTNPNIVLAATSNGIYKSINAGNTWTQVRFGNFSQGRIRFKPNDPSIIYGVSTQRFCRSTNTGDSFITVATGLPASSSRMLMDVTNANDNLIYVLSANSSGNFQGVYKSINGGDTFTATNTTTNVFESPQSGYDLALAVSQTNENEIYVGCLNLWRSLNGGTTFSKRNNWSSPTSSRYTHADIHYLRYFGNKLYCGSDGGVYVSSTSATLSNFTDLTSGAQISQFYKIAVSNQSAGKMMGGLQDNGGHALSNNQWKNYFGADGMDTAVDPNNSNIFYGFIQFGGNLYISSNAGNSSSGGVGAPDAETSTGDDGGRWITPLVTNNSGEVFAGYSNLYKLTQGQWVKQNVGEFGIGDFRLISIDPNNDDIMYVSSDSELYKSVDRGIVFEPMFDAPGTITSIDVHSSNSNIVYITTQGTSGIVMKSVDGGLTFTSINTGLPNIGKNVIVHQGRNVSNPLFVGTSLGVYYRDDTMSQWEPFDANLPNVSVTDLDINLEDQKITAATYGRGIWQASIEVEVPTNDVKIVEITNPISTTLNCSSGIVAPQFVVKNSGSSIINTINFSYSYNAINNNFTWNGSLLPNQSQSITLPEVNLPKNVYLLTINASISNDEVIQNNSGTKSFVINTPGILYETNTFESETDNLLAYDDSGLFATWQRGNCTTGVLDTGNNNVYASNLTGNYDNNRKAYLTTGCYDLTQIVNPVMSFKMAYDLELNYDIVYLEYTINNGQNWFRLGELAPNWYSSDRTPETSGTDCENCVGGQWTGSNLTLTEYTYPLNSFTAIQNVIFRIVFHSDSGLTQLGIVVDDFLITGTSLASNKFELNKIAIYPNPSKGIFNLSLNNLPIDIFELTDLTGKKIDIIKKFKINNNETQLDLTAVSDGVYFIKITANNQSITKKIIKN